MNSEDYLFILYTSGSTGTPKGIAHSTAGYLLYASFTHKHVFGYYDNTDVFGCVADIGWITGTNTIKLFSSYQLTPLLMMRNGCYKTFFGGNLDFPIIIISQKDCSDI